MLRQPLAVLTSLLLALSLSATTSSTPAAPNLNAKEIADKNAAARGGLQAWRTVETLSLSGKMGIGGNQRATLQVPNPA